MPFNYEYGQVFQTVRVPLRLINAAYGPDNYYNAGDDFLYCVRQVEDFPFQYESSFSYDTMHPNPWYHDLVFTVRGITAAHYQKLIELLYGYRLAEDSTLE